MQPMSLFFSQLKTVIRRIGIPIFALSFLYTIADQLLTELMQRELSSPAGITWQLIAAGFASMFLSLTVPLFSNLLIIYAAKLPPLRFRSLLNSALIEELRAMGKVMLWFLLLILPGFIKLVQFVFVPFVVALDPQYRQGHRDALDYSKKLVNRHFWKISLLLLLFSLVIPVFMTEWDEYRVFWKHPFGNLLLTGVQSLLSIVLGLLLLVVWEKAYESDVQLERN